jgi:hypothetical protein
LLKPDCGRKRLRAESLLTVIGTVPRTGEWAIQVLGSQLPRGSRGAYGEPQWELSVRAVGCV